MIQSVGNVAFKRLCTRNFKFCILSVAVMLSACTTQGVAPDNVLRQGAASQQNSSSDPTENPVTPTDQTILRDLAQVVRQIYDPIDTTLQVTYGNTNSTLQYFIGLLANQGFGIQRVSADQGANFVSYTRSENKLNGKPFIRFAVAVGAVTIARDYTVPRKHMIAPASTLRLSGTRVPVTIKDKPSGRMQIVNNDYSHAEYVASLNLDEQAPVISLITPSLVNKVAKFTATGPSLQALNSSKVEVNNLFYGDQSTFSSVLDDFKQINKQIIVFGNDSMVLGDTNKSLIEQFVEKKFRTGDLISLVGCSNGPTALAIGNEGLALGRANRVTEALLAHGVSRQNILDEGCWAPVKAGDRFPGRGVVMELWRKTS